MKDNWKIFYPEVNLLNNIIQNFNFNKMIATILLSKGLSDNASIDKFLFPQIYHLISPFNFSNIHSAIQRIKKSIKEKEKIGIFADSDLDGLTSLAVLKNLFKKFNIDIDYRYPSGNEKYGLSKKIIDEFIEKKINLLITVDSGIRDCEEIAYAKSMGIDVIITDHHEEGEEIPDAIVINPKQKESSYSFKGLAGVGVAFKLSQALLLSYLPTYNQRYIIFFNDNKQIFFSIIKNGIIEKIGDFSEKEILQDDIFVCLKKDKNILGKYTDKINFFEDIFSDSFKIPKTRLTPIERLSQEFIRFYYTHSRKINSFVKENISLVALGTVADVVPLIDENRFLVNLGLKYFYDSEANGLALVVNSKKITSKTIGWEVAPLLNSPTRYGETDYTADFLLGKDLSILSKLKDKISILNQKRKDDTNRVFQEIILSEDIYFNKDICCVIDNTISPGLSGLLANKLSDYFQKPTIVLTKKDENNCRKGSGRSFNEIDFFPCVIKLEDSFEKLGGHSQAFGFTIHESKIENVVLQINENCEKKENNYILKINQELDISNIDSGLIEQLQIFEPYGKGNEEPVFISKNVVIKEFQFVGKDKAHGKYKFSNNEKITAYGWNIGKLMEEFYTTKKAVDIVYSLEKNFFHRKLFLKMIIKDLDYS